MNRKIYPVFVLKYDGHIQKMMPEVCSILFQAMMAMEVVVLDRTTRVHMEVDP